MISAGDFRNGITIEYDNNVYQIIEFQHVLQVISEMVLPLSMITMFTRLSNSSMLSRERAQLS